MESFLREEQLYGERIEAEALAQYKCPSLDPRAQVEQPKPRGKGEDPFGIPRMTEAQLAIETPQLRIDNTWDPMVPLSRGKGCSRGRLL